MKRRISDKTQERIMIGAILLLMVMLVVLGAAGIIGFMSWLMES